MKAIIKICKVGKFTDKDRDVFRRLLNVLSAHNLSAAIYIKEKTKLKLKTA